MNKLIIVGIALLFCIISLILYFKKRKKPQRHDLFAGHRRKMVNIDNRIEQLNRQIYDDQAFYIDAEMEGDKETMKFYDEMIKEKEKELKRLERKKKQKRK